MPSWKKVILSGSDAALNSLDVTTSLTASGLIYPITDGTINQSIVTDGAGNLTFGDPFSSNTVVFGKNVSGAPIIKGTPLYFTGSGTMGNTVGIWPADAGNPARMPAGGIAGEAIANGAEGVVLLDGFINGVNTSTFSSGDVVYVAVGGGYTNIRPTGSTSGLPNQIQELGYVERSDISNGSGVIKGPGITSNVPNIEPNYLFVGNSDWVATPVSTASLFVTSASYAITSTSASHALNADNAISASYALTSSFASTGNNFVGTGTTFLGNLDLGSLVASGASVTTTTSSLVPDSSTNLTLISLGVDSAEAMFIDYVLYDLAKNNKRAGNLRLTWNASTTVFDETSTIDIGDTSQFTFTVDNSGGSFELLATNTTGQDMYLIYEYKFLYIV
jgi:hypothetical protein